MLIGLIVQRTEVIERSEDATLSWEEISDHFVDVNKMIELGKGEQRSVEDIVVSSGLTT